MKNILVIILFILALPTFAFAHQPRIVETGDVKVIDPEISKAYYGVLSGESHTYTIESEEAFELYVGILEPDIESAKKDFVAEIYKGDAMIEKLGGPEAEWKSFFEPFGQSTYWDGGEYRAEVEAGTYKVVVSSPDNEGKYSLAIGGLEFFDQKEGLNALRIIPELKRDFFEESPISFIKSPFGWGYILILYILAFIVGFLYRFLLKKFAKGTARGAGKNIGKYDRIIRLVIWIGLLVWAITTSWSPWLIFFSGFALFEAIFSWCGFYAALGKNTCPS